MERNDTDVTSLLAFIKRNVNKYLAPSFDRESVAHDIWLECELKHLKPSLLMIRHRCIDASRARKLRSEREKESLTRKCLCEHVLADDEKQLITQIVETAKLEPSERQVVYLFYYAGHTLENISLLTKLSHSQVTSIKASALLKLKRAASFLERKD